MIVMECHGTGKEQATNQLPCNECGGTGVVHCCDGLCEQPLDDHDDTATAA